jgi:hypothetical protein
MRRPRGDEITIEHLARHTAGIPHRVTECDEGAVPRTAADMVQLVIERVERDGLLVEPGTNSVYSSAGYSVLARVLELTGGASWEELRIPHDPALRRDEGGVVRGLLWDDHEMPCVDLAEADPIPRPN